MEEKGQLEVLDVEKPVEEKTKFQKLKEMWKNPKQRSIISLGFWLIFIVVAILLVRPSSTTIPIESENILSGSFASMKSYEFTYIFNEGTFIGQVYEDKTLFYLNNKRYYVNKNVYIIEKDIGTKTELDLNILKINSIMLAELIKNITPTEINGYKQYLIPLIKFIDLYDKNSNIDLNLASNFNIVMNVYGNSTTDKIELELANYINLRDGTNIQYPVIIYFNNINNVSDFSKGYDKMIGVKE